MFRVRSSLAQDFEQTLFCPPAYEITGEELAWLVERVTILQETVAAICAEHLTGPAEA